MHSVDLWSGCLFWAPKTELVLFLFEISPRDYILTESNYLSKEISLILI